MFSEAIGDLGIRREDVARFSGIGDEVIQLFASRQPVVVKLVAARAHGALYVVLAVAPVGFDEGKLGPLGVLPPDERDQAAPLRFRWDFDITQLQDRRHYVERLNLLFHRVPLGNARPGHDERNFYQFVVEGLPVQHATVV